MTRAITHFIIVTCLLLIVTNTTALVIGTVRPDVYSQDISIKLSVMVLGLGLIETLAVYHTPEQPYTKVWRDETTSPKEYGEEAPGKTL
jgi:hypothetical protein